jgi:hypothetical protein
MKRSLIAPAHLAMLALCSSGIVDYVQGHGGSDDGIELFRRHGAELKPKTDAAALTAVTTPPADPLFDPPRPSRARSARTTGRRAGRSIRRIES